MYIERNMEATIRKNLSLVQILTGPRQCGKSTLFSRLSGPSFRELSLDDFRLRTLANNDPGMFLEQFPPPLLIDEVQYAPNLFPEIKQIVDGLKRKRLETEEKLSVLFRLTGSNQILLDKNVRESLVGRVSWFSLNTLSIREIRRSFPEMPLSEILFKGGWPELYIDSDISVVDYLNDYLRSTIEKDILLSAGILKQESFGTLLGLLAARTGMLLDYTDLSRETGVRSVTIKEWVGLLERSAFVERLPPYFSNLNKRLTKTPKIYFMDTGIAVRLQGWREYLPLMTSPQAGALFETLVFSEITKYIHNTGKNWQLFFWRTREGEEIDFLIMTEDGKVLALDAKMNVYVKNPALLPSSFRKVFPETREIVLVTFGGERLRLSKECLLVPVASLHQFLDERSSP